MPPRVTSGPNHPHDALAWIKEAVREDRYEIIPHFIERLASRHVPMDDAVYMLMHGARAEPYPAQLPQHGGTSWRIHGKDSTGRRLAIGVEAYLDEGGRAAVLCTVIDMSKRGGR